jgi:hypothetical protein
VDDAISHNQSQIKVQFSRRDIPIPAPKVLRIHSPFLLLYTRQPVPDTNEQHSDEEKSSRSKRSIDSYYQYMPVDEDDNEERDTNTVVNSPVNSDAVWRENFEKFRRVGPRLLQERVTVRLTFI